MRDWRDEIRESRGGKWDVCSEARCLISSLVARISNLRNADEITSRLGFEEQAGNAIVILHPEGVGQNSPGQRPGSVEEHEISSPEGAEQNDGPR